MIQDVVFSVSVILMVLLAIVFLWVAAGADSKLADYAPIIARAYRFRVWLFLLAMIVLVGTNWRTLGELPYVHAARAAPADAAVTRSDAVAEQWDWSVTPHKFKVGQTAEFHVTTKDVNHGFALYDPGMHIVAEVQAMPGYTNVLRYTFATPGKYQVLCLEYCGLAHHEMKTDIDVAAQ